MTFKHQTKENSWASTNLSKQNRKSVYEGYCITFHGILSQKHSKFPQPIRKYSAGQYITDQRTTIAKNLSCNRWLWGSREPRPLLCQTLTAAFTLLLQPGSKELLVFRCFSLGLGNSLLLFCNSCTLPLQSQRSYQPLNFRCLANLLTCQTEYMKNKLTYLSRWNNSGKKRQMTHQILLWRSDDRC